MKNLIIFACIVLTMSSCEKVLFQKNQASLDPITNFDYLWSEVDKKYSYFELKGIDWNAVRDRYRPLVTSSTSEEDLFRIMGDMLAELRDDHTNLISPFDVSRYDIRLRTPENYYARTIDLYYVPDAMLTGAFKHGFLDSGQIAYIRYASFIDNFSNEQMEYILKRYQNTKGMILDMRENGGGYVTNVSAILGRFTDSKVLVGYNKTRNGAGHGEFGPDEPFYVPAAEGTKYTKPIILLTDRGSYSATTFFSLASKAFPNITMVGDTTGGGGGLPNGGQLPNGWTYRFSVSQLLDLEKRNYAESGVPPAIHVDFDWTDLTHDEILDRAIQELQ